MHQCCLFSADSPDEDTDLTVAKEQRRFAHSAAEQKRRDAIRVSCYFILQFMFLEKFVSKQTICAFLFMKFLFIFSERLRRPTDNCADLSST